MWFENLELTMSHVGLGDLNEYALMVLFGNAHSHHLVLNTNLKPDQIQNGDGAALYPAYFMTKLRVPVSKLLSSFKLWENISVGVDVKRFGDTLLESRYILGRKDQVSEAAEEWDRENYPYMEGNNLIVVDSVDETTTKRKVSNPSSEFIAELPKSDRSPQGIMLSKKIRAHGFDRADLPGFAFSNRNPISYTVASGRDVASGHAMIFAKFSEIMDFAEYDYLSKEFSPAFPDDVLAHLSVLEREIYYYGNCYAGEVLDIRLAGSIEICEDEELQESCDYIPFAILNVIFEVYQKRNKTLLVTAKTKKVFGIPMRNQDLASDIYRIVAQAKRGG